MLRTVDNLQRHNILHTQRELGIHLTAYLNLAEQRVGNVIYRTDDKQHHQIGAADEQQAR